MLGHLGRRRLYAEDGVRKRRFAAWLLQGGVHPIEAKTDPLMPTNTHLPAARATFHLLRLQGGWKSFPSQAALLGGRGFTARLASLEREQSAPQRACRRTSAAATSDLSTNRRRWLYPRPRYPV